MFNAVRILPLATAIAVALAFSPAVATAQATAPAHEHDHATAGKLSLDHGSRWPTDETLRTGMSRIRALVEPQIGPIHAGKLSTAQYGDLAQQIESQVGYIVANCKLDPNADAMLHLVIADIGAGVDAMAGKTPTVRPAQGAAAVVVALNDYGRYFNDPGFKPLKH